MAGLPSRPGMKRFWPMRILLASCSWRLVSFVGSWPSLGGPSRSSSHIRMHQAAPTKASQRTDTLTDEWIDIQGARAKFGAKTPFRVSLGGAPDLAKQWLYGDGPSDNSVDRLVQAGKPAFSKIQRAKDLESSATGMQVYEFSLPTLDLMGLGKATSSINLFGAIRNMDGPDADKFLDIGTFGNPRASIQFATGAEIALPMFSLNVTGALSIEGDAISERRSEAVGWVSIEVQGEVPSVAGITLPEEVLRAAAKEACRQTCAYASRKLEVELSEDFASWRAERVRRERSRK
ncbi:unnamed protein product [Symbiodinium sp. CCMP2456]|nr:unnamed protein product [Symbiodinium sp. CCMP2456]